MELFETDSSFLVGGAPVSGIPFLLDREFEEVRCVNDYLYFTAAINGRTRSPNTWRRYAEALKEYFSFLEENDVDWNEHWSTSTSLIVGWRQQMLNSGNATSYINQQLNLLSRFFDWCVNQGMIALSPLPEKSTIQLNRSNSGFLAHAQGSDQTRSVNTLTLREFEEPIKFLNIEQVPTFIAALSSRRDRLIARLLVEAGLRREEAVLLHQSCVPKLSSVTDDQPVRLILDATVTPTKGTKSRWVQVSYDLACKLTQYALVERSQRIGRKQKDHGHLFVNRHGGLLTLGALNKAFKIASEKTGINCTPHMLRHTFGTYELQRLKKTGTNEGNALAWVRDRMGHSSVTTTERYLHLIDEYGDAALGNYQDTIDQLLKDDPLG